MAKDEWENFIDRAREIAVAEIAALTAVLGDSVDLSVLSPGKMVRTQMVAHLLPALPAGTPTAVLIRACAAIETVHTASLCHDDVVDESLTRRHRPSLWRLVGSSSSSVLIGDLLLCRALELIADIEDGRHVRSFLSKTREVCETEARQELRLRGQILDESDCLAVARGKTGPLFAFLGGMCGNDDKTLQGALEEAGYCLGTVYQILDDVVDVAGSEETAGKSVGRDRSRGKLTLAQRQSNGVQVAIRQARELLDGMFDQLSPWPACRRGMEVYVADVLEPVFARQLQEIDLSVLIGANT